MKQHLRMALVFAAVSSLASCSGGGSSNSGGLPPASGSGQPGTTPPPSPVPASLSIVQWGSFTSYNQPNFKVTMPVAPAVGNLIVIALWNNGQIDGRPNTYTPPPGWTQLDSNLNYYATYQAFEHVVAASDTNSYVFTPTSGLRQTVWMAAEVRGASSSDPIDQVRNAYVDSKAPVFTTAALTPSHSGELALAFNMPIEYPSGSVTWSNPPNWKLGVRPTYIWDGDALYQAQSGTTPVSQSSTLSGTFSGGFSALVLLNP